MTQAIRSPLSGRASTGPAWGALACRCYESRIFQKLSLRATSPSESNVQTSHPRTSIEAPSTVVPVIVHSDTPRAPQAK